MAREGKGTKGEGQKEEESEEGKWGMEIRGFASSALGG